MEWENCEVKWNTRSQDELECIGNRIVLRANRPYRWECVQYSKGESELWDRKTEGRRRVMNTNQGNRAFQWNVLEAPSFCGGVRIDKDRVQKSRGFFCAFILKWIIH